MKAIVLGKAERQILAGVPVLFLAGTLIHFLYGLSGEFFLVGLLAPVNESVWEHLKLALELDMPIIVHDREAHADGVLDSAAVRS